VQVHLSKQLLLDTLVPLFSHATFCGPTLHFATSCRYRIQMRAYATPLSLLWALLVYVGAATESSSSITSLAPQTATITTLPPAQPSINSTNPCNFTDRDALLERVVVDWQSYNVSLLAETCPNVCELIYGNGNPDVSGIGVCEFLLGILGSCSNSKWNRRWSRISCSSCRPYALGHSYI
jgi:hypothetical protein